MAGKMNGFAPNALSSATTAFRAFGDVVDAARAAADRDAHAGLYLGATSGRLNCSATALVTLSSFLV